MKDYIPLHAKGIHKSKIHSFESFINHRDGAELLKGSIKSEEPEGNYFSANIVAKRGYEEEIIKGIVGPGYASEVYPIDVHETNHNYKIMGD